MVTIPKIQRIQPSATMPQNERINLKVENNAQDILQRTNAVVGLVETGADVYQKFEDQTINTLSAEAERDYTAWNNQELTKLKSIQGDPTDAYQKYEEAATIKYNEILEKRPDVSERVKRHLTANLNKVSESQRVNMMKQRGAQQETYQNNLYESSLKLKRNNLNDSAGFIRKGDPGSYMMFDETISDISTTIAKRAVDKGLGQVVDPDSKDYDHMYRNEDGNLVKVKLNDIAKVRRAKELSEGIYASINSMNAAGYKDEAREAYQRYAPYMETRAKTALDNKFKTGEVKTQAYEEIQKIEGKSEQDQMRAIESIEDAELKSEVLKIKDTNDNRRENIRNRKYKANYNTLANRVIEKMNSGTPYFGLADLEADPVYREVWDNLDPKGKKAIIDSVQTPKQTDPQALARVQSLFIGEDPENQLEGMDAATFQTYLSGLGTVDRRKYSDKFLKLNTQSAAGERTAMKRAGKMLEEQFLADDHIRRDKYGKISGDDEITLIRARQKLIDYMDDQGPMSEKEMKDFVIEFSAAEVKGQTFSPAPRNVFNSGPRGRPNAQTVAPASKNEVVLSNNELSSMKREFRRINGYFPSNTDEKFKNFVTSRRGN